MAIHEEYEVASAPWRNTALQPMLWVIEGHAAIPLLFAVLPFSVPKFYIALCIVIVLAIIRYMGYDALSAYRTLQSLVIRALTGGVIRSVPTYLSR